VVTLLSLRLAEPAWKVFFEPMYGPLGPIIKALLALPPDQVVEVAVPRPPIVFHSREGVVRGQRFRIFGFRADGKFSEIIEAQAL
jgi:hypothetical protein